MPNAFDRDNQAYEKWLATHCDIVEPDLEHKHKRMCKNPFVFLRATFFRWARTIEGILPELTSAPAVPSVGDIHTENFGIWRDGDGRLVWGVNDFDETDIIPYAFDLVRLLTSIRLANITIGRKDAADALLEGYRDGAANPRPAIVYQNGPRINAYAQPTQEKCETFWAEFVAIENTPTPPEVVAALTKSLPSRTQNIRICARPKKGGGGLGRPRYVALGEWQGGLVVREAKAWVPSAWAWAHGKETRPGDCLKMAKGRFRSADPYFTQPKGLNFTIRRLAPDSRKIELGKDAGADLHIGLLKAMGADLAAIHASGKTPMEDLIADLDRRKGDWLHEAARTAEAAVIEDWEAWRAVVL